MITVATLFWSPNSESQHFSRSYDESWVEKLYRGFARHLTQPFRFVCYTDRPRAFIEPIEQRQISSPRPSYRDCVQPYEMDTPMILVGLDTVIVGNCDALAAHALQSERLALPRDPYNPAQACTGVALAPAGLAYLWTDWDRSGDDMERMRCAPHDLIDDLFPGRVVSYKGHAEHKGISGVSIVYFHGRKKPGEISDAWVSENWR